jgi:UDP-N-acetylmuramyl pentapeptide synthase
MLAAGGRTILDACYNANPASMSAAIATVVASVGGAGSWARAFAVLGDMLEVGADSEEHHRALGREAGVRLAGVVALGDFAGAVVDGARAAGLAGDRTKVAGSPEEAAAVVASWTAPGDWILVKASRGMRLERVVDALRGGL